MSSRCLTLGSLLCFALVACATDDVTTPPRAAEGSFTIDARTAWVYLNLADSAIVTPAPSATESTAWDVAFFATNVTLNGGAAGPGAVTGACLCQNEAVTDQAILAMTPESQLPAYDAITSVPAGVTYMSDALTPAVAGWFTGSGTAAVAAPAKTYLVRLSDSLSYAKLRVKTLQGATAISAGRVTLEFAVQSSATATLGATQTLEVDLTTGAKSVDLNTGALTTSATDWDLRLDGFVMRVNGGVSGPGKGGAAAGTDAFENTTTAVTAANAYRTDTYAGIFGAKRFYRYNILGDNRISPTFDVYLVKRGSAVYKLQIVSYYNATGTARYLTFRYKQIAG